jgi:hypothetical protein
MASGDGLSRIWATRFEMQLLIQSQVYPMNEDKIRKRVTSDDAEVLNRSLSFITERLDIERSRVNRAEDRAAALFAVSGILAGFIIHFSELLILPGKAGWLVLLSLYLGSITFLIKSAIYAIRALWALKGYELTPELVFDFQSLSEVNVVREEIIWKIWEYYQLLPVSNLRLFRTNRAQRNLLASIISFGLLGLAWFFIETAGISVKGYLDYICAIGVLVATVFLDKMFECLGNLWSFE